jgi:hypothetical protein
LEVAVFRQCVHHVGRQNYAGFPKHLQICGFFLGLLQICDVAQVMIVHKKFSAKFGDIKKYENIKS